jgi:hypothetical protein
VRGHQKSDKSDKQGKTIIKAFQKAHDEKQRWRKRETEGGEEFCCPAVRSSEKRLSPPLPDPKGVMQPAWVLSSRALTLGGCERLVEMG